MEGGSFGLGSVSGDFDPVAYIKKPCVILRLIGWVFSIIVFGCISSQGWDSKGKCLYNEDAGACHFGTAIGVIAFLDLIVFLVIDAKYDNLASTEFKKYIVIGDIAFSGFWSFMWFVCFCYLTDKWRTRGDHDVAGKSGVEAAIAFSFFSILVFAALTFLAVRKYQAGIEDDFHSGYDPNLFGESDTTGRLPESQTTAPYQTPGDYGQQSPFADPAAKPTPPAGGYQAQSY